ncbi:MAG: winged helix-turn-helix domain-containing protein [Chlorobiota bacterium]
MFEKLDKILNQQVRLAIISVLVNVKSADFKYLREVTKTTQGNLSHQLKVLSDEGYIEIKKTFKDNYPNTKCIITKKGLNAFEKYVEAMKKYLNINNQMENVK